MPQYFSAEDIRHAIEDGKDRIAKVSLRTLMDLMRKKGSDEVYLLTALSNYVNIRRYMQSQECKAATRRAIGHSERLLKQSRKLPKKLRAFAKELMDDPRPYAVWPIEANLLRARVWATLFELADKMGELPGPRQGEIFRSPRRADYTTILDDILAYIEATTGGPHLRDIWILLNAACELAEISAPDEESIQKSRQRHRR